ncbi:MAG: hypothetical protein H7Z43_12425, partial [Clostridia bacterium]|nr:hypothetical protein [Deltaproteobacteria bacterium]
MAISLTACNAALEIPSGTLIGCEDDADCPEELLCIRGTCFDARIADAARPTLVSVAALSPTSLRVSYSERMEGSTIEKLDAYDVVSAIDGVRLELTLARAEFDVQSVTLGTATQRVGSGYMLAVTGVADTALNAIADNATLAFVGYGTADPLPPEPIAPVNDVLVRPLDVTLAWQPRPGASYYELELTSGGAPSQTIRMPADRVIAHAPEDFPALEFGNRYLWRVRSDLSAWSETVSFIALDDGVYVYCQPDTACDDAQHSGTRDDPLQTVSGGILAAKAYGVGKVRVASRCRATPCNLLSEGTRYDGLVSLEDGVSLYGGYEPTFIEPVDRERSPTNIFHDGFTALLASEIGKGSEPTIVSGFNIFSDNRQDSISYAVFIENSVRLILEQCDVRSDSYTFNSVGVLVTGSPADSFANAVTLRDLSVVSAQVPELSSVGTASSTGVAILRSWAVLQGVNVTSRGTTYDVTDLGERIATGMEVSRSSVRIDGSTLRGGTHQPTTSDSCSGSSIASSTGLRVRSNSNVNVTNSYIRSSATCESVALSVSDSRLIATNDTLRPEASVNQTHAVVVGQSFNPDDTPVALTNLIIAVATSVPSTVDHSAVHEVASGLPRFAFENNAIAGFPCLRAGMSCATSASSVESAMIAARPPGRTRASATIAFATAAELFLDANFTRPSSRTPVSIVVGGKDTSQATCGDNGALDCGRVTADFDKRL